MYFKTENGPVRVNSSMMKTNGRHMMPDGTMMDDSMMDGDVPIYKKLWFWLLIIALIVIIIVCVMCCMKKQK